MVCDFATFYRAVHDGREPFPWQRRLAARVAREGWPPEIGVPTGLGKTSCLDIAVWALAIQAERPPRERSAPTRIWYVVNRRLLVDAAFDHGQRLAHLLENPHTVGSENDRSALRGVAEALEAIRGGAGTAPLHVTRLRGGADLGARPPDPAQPSLVFATVPMFGSRWLFRGFGSSTSMRPVDAALAGTDSLVLLDEAHLAKPLRDLAQPLAECDVGQPSRVLPLARSRPVIVSLTATGDLATTFTLDDEDHAHPEVIRRTTTAKPVRLVETQQRDLVNTLVDETRRALAGRPPSAAVVFVNTPRVAREVFGELQRHAREPQGTGSQLVLLTGLMREREASAVRDLLLDPESGAPAGRARSRTQHLVVVATQTLEVGADLDFDLLVTEACGVRALVQRLGRLNRLGEAHQPAGVVVYPADATTFGIYGEEPLPLWRRLRQAATGGMVDLAPTRVAAVIGAAQDRPLRVGELLPAHVWEWAKTSAPPAGEAPPELFYAGFDDDVARVSVTWRLVIPQQTGAELRPPISSGESIDLPISEARRGLQQAGLLTVTQLAPDLVSVITGLPLDRIRPGDHLVIPVHVGGYDRYGWAPGSTEPVFDISLMQPPGPPLSSNALRTLCAEGEALDAAAVLAEALARPPESDDDLDRLALAQQLVHRIVAAGPSPQLHPDEWDRLRSGLRPRVDYPVDDVPRLQIQPPARRGSSLVLRSDAFDELSFARDSVSLADHLNDVGTIAARIATQIGLSDDLINVVRDAGRLHDLGKADVRFQRWLDPDAAADEPVAKSRQPWSRWQRDRRAAGWPRGGRHEELSRRLAAAWLEIRTPRPDDSAGKSSGDDPDNALLLHLITSHHGHGRPLVPGTPDVAPVELTAQIDGTPVKASGDLTAIDWAQPARFRGCCERYGYWGLALLEAVVRQADHQASALVAI